jgi:hypothetical protein
MSLEKNGNAVKHNLLLIKQIAQFLKTGVFFINKQLHWPELHLFILNCAHLVVS